MDDDSIINAAKEYGESTGFSDIVFKAKGVNSAAGIGFLEGAVWARRQMMKDAVKATIPFEREYNEYIRTEAFIKKVINFLNYKLADVVAIRVAGKIIPHHVAKQKLIEDLEKYMKG